MADFGLFRCHETKYDYSNTVCTPVEENNCQVSQFT